MGITIKTTMPRISKLRGRKRTVEEIKQERQRTLARLKEESRAEREAEKQAEAGPKPPSSRPPRRRPTTMKGGGLFDPIRRAQRKAKRKMRKEQGANFSGATRKVKKQQKKGLRQMRKQQGR